MEVFYLNEPPVCTSSTRLPEPSSPLMRASASVRRERPCLLSRTRRPKVAGMSVEIEICYLISAAEQCYFQALGIRFGTRFDAAFHCVSQEHLTAAILGKNVRSCPCNDAADSERKMASLADILTDLKYKSAGSDLCRRAPCSHVEDHTELVQQYERPKAACQQIGRTHQEECATSKAIRLRECVSHDILLLVDDGWQQGKLPHKPSMHLHITTATAPNPRHFPSPSLLLAQPAKQRSSSNYS